MSSNGARPTAAYIRLDRLEHNLCQIRAAAGDAGIIAVVKANAYGHGMIEAAKILEPGVRFFGVAIPEEGIRLRESGIKSPILVMGGILPQSAPLVAEGGLSQTVFSEQTLRALEAEGQKRGVKIKVHIKADTGMNRVGVKRMDEFRALLAIIKGSEALELEGLFTHFAESEAEDTSFTRAQGERFLAFIEQMEAEGFSGALIHASNSAAALGFPELCFDLVRPGLALYGVNPNPSAAKASLKPVMEWKTRIVHLKTIEAGESVSYCRTYTAPSRRTIATLMVGYGDGYKRAFSNRAEVLIRGQRAKIIGNVCMDQCVADVSDIPGAAIGDEAVLLGCQGGECITAEELALWAGTISYEILLSVSERVPRVYLNNE